MATRRASTTTETEPCEACGAETSNYNRNGEPVCTDAPFCGDYVESILAVYDAATDAELRAGEDWYPTMTATMRRHAAESGYSIEQCAAVYAACSANTQWVQNVRLACRAIADGGLTGGTLTNTVSKVNAILAGADIDSTIAVDAKSLKLRNFIRNLSGCVDSVTVDRWARRIATRGAQSDVPKGDLYRKIAEAYITAALWRNTEPSTMQAVTWVVVTGTAAA